MNVYAVGDLHGQLLPIPDDAGLVLLAGDVCPDSTDDEQKAWCERDLRPWLSRAPCSVVSVAGNHDHLFFKDRDVAKSLPWVYLKGETAEVAGLKVHGFPWVPDDRDSDWSSLPERIESHAAKIPDGLDVLLLHAGPAGFGDRMNHDCHANPLRCGNAALKEAVASRKPKLVVFGHTHETRGSWLWRDSYLVNATTGYNGSERGRGYREKKPFGWFKVDWASKPSHQPADFRAMLCAPGRYAYDRVGLGVRHLKLEWDGTVGEGSARMERNWRVRHTHSHGAGTLIISGDREDCMRLILEEDGVWRGSWLNYEKNRVELRRVS